MIVFEIFFVIALGCLFHFTYAWSKFNQIVGWLTAVNESVWEHVKIALLPIYLTILVDFGTFGENLNYFFAKFVMAMSAIILIPGTYYLVKAIFKKTTLIVDIMLFILDAIYTVLAFDFTMRFEALNLELVGIIGLGLTFVAFALLSYWPPKCFLFYDPLHHGYGPQKHSHHHDHEIAHIETMEEVSEEELEDKK